MQFLWNDSGESEGDPNAAMPVCAFAPGIQSGMSLKADIPL
jgi:hypothetical protein